MPELILEIGGRVFEVACNAGEEPSLERAGALLDAEATRLGEAGLATEKRMLLLAGLMLADTMTGVQEQLRQTEERLRHAEERVRIAEAKSAMLANVERKFFSGGGTRRPRRAITPTAKAMSVAIGMPHPSAPLPPSLKTR